MRKILIWAATAAAFLAVNTPANAQTIVSYDLEGALPSGFGGWQHSYTGSIVDDGSGLDYTGGRGTLNDGVEGGYTAAQLFYVNQNDFSFTGYLNGNYTLSEIQLLWDDTFNYIPGTLTGATLSFGGVTRSVPIQRMGPYDSRLVLPLDFVGISSNQFTLSGFTGGWSGYGGFSEVVALGSSAVSGVPEPSTWAMMLVGFGGVGFAMRRAKKADRKLAFAAA